MAKQDSNKIAAKFLTGLLEHIKNATYRGSWGGYDGAQQYIKSDRVQMLKEYNAIAYTQGMAMCFGVIVNSTVEKQNSAVLKAFVKEHPQFIVNMAKINPHFFENPEIEKLCQVSLANDERKVFSRHLKRHQKKAANETA